MEIWKEGHGVQAKGGAEGGLLESQHCREGCLPSAGSLQLLFKAERSPPAPGQKAGWAADGLCHGLYKRHCIRCYKYLAHE